uniref:1-phosphatidylinositol-3-phosphate 5-kinase n=3 Tax=Lygus hesperus TaxID=30085 RepID=A0A146LP56_LYGHE
MNRDPNNLSKLTEFPPLSPAEEESSGISGIFARFFRTSKAPEDQTSGIKQEAPEQPTACSSYDEWGDQSEKDEKEEDGLPINIKEGRSLPSVRKRIGNLLALKSTGRQSYNDTELKQYWMPDSVSKECYNCGERFTTFRRRHHCRVCGQIFCSRCCNQQIPGKIMNCTGDLRVCLYCGRVVLSYLKSAELNSELSAEHLALLKELQSKFGDSNDLEVEGRVLATPDREEVRRKPSVGYQEERFGSGPRGETAGRCSLRCLLDELMSSGGLVCGTHRFRLRTYSLCFPASHLIDCLVAQNKAGNRQQAIVMGQALQQSGHIESVSHESAVFADNNVLFKVLPFEPLREEMQDSNNESDEYLLEKNTIRSSTSSYNLDLNVDNKTAHISKPQESSQQTLSTSEASEKSPVDGVGETGAKAVSEVTSTVNLDVIDWNTVEPCTLDEDQKNALVVLRSCFSTHCSNFLRQILNNQGVPQSWAEIITPIACQIVKNIRPEKSKNWMEAMDIRQYVQIKKVGGGERRECKIITGVVCSKNLSHRKMPTIMDEPRILLLSSSIMFQRDEGKYLGLEPVIMQEHDYIQRIVYKIVNLRPNLVIVGKSVARLAQDLLLDAGISLVLNVKPSVVERIARSTGADILTSVDAHLGAPELGVCKSFQIMSLTTETGRKKTLMIFEGCRYPELGCTILLRGASTNELSKVKRATSSLLFAYYNARLEVSYHMDSLAELPPTSKEEFLLDSLDEQPTADRLISPDEIYTPTKRVNAEDKPSKPSQETPKSLSETVSDLSDPLRSTWRTGDELESNKEYLALVEVPNEPNSFKKALDDNLLSVSPFLKFSLPYLETEVGRSCALRSFFGQRLYWSPQLCDDYPKQRSSTIIEEIPTTIQRLENTKLKEIHPFVLTKLTQPSDSVEVQTLLANFRAVGGRIPIQPDPAYSSSAQLPPLHEKSKDILDPGNHQRLAVLFCSYSPLSRNAPSFCVDPWIVDMEMYGRMDIPLGQFLERYCFRSEYTCGSEACETPVLEHTRRFVHNGGAVHIKLRNLEKEIPPLGGILMWSWCVQCSKMTPIRCMSPGAKCMSFAKYLELRFHADMYKVRNIDCTHSLHQDHVHYFAMSKTLATFTYSKISPWEVCLPPQTLLTEREVYNEAAKLEELKTWMLMGNQVFNSVLMKVCSLSLPDGIATSLKQQLQKDQALYKQRVEDMQRKLSPSTGVMDSPKLSVGHMWSVEDSLVRLKRQLAEAVEEWNIRLCDAEAAAKREDKKKNQEVKVQQNSLSEIIDGEKEMDEPVDPSELQVGIEANEPDDNKSGDVFSEMESAVDTDDDVLGEPIPPTALSQETADKEDRKPSDKKSVKTVWSQLLSTSSHNVHIQLATGQFEHYMLPYGTMMPLVVYEKEPSSIIAYALNSFDYKTQLDQMKARQLDQQSPSLKRKSGSGADLESSGGDKKSGVLSYLRTASSNSMDKNVRGSIEGVQYNPQSTSSNENFLEEEQKVTDESKGKSLKTEAQNIEVNFSDGTASFKVKVYYAEDFAKLRASVLPEEEEGFIRSLSRCVAWAASGGKSGSNFNKTKDDRFILKAMARIEFQQFLACAPQYFNYINCRVTNGAPTLLGKILGVYRVACRSEKSNTTVKLLVMEHLFHGRCIRHKFDLKGSMRNRLVETTNEPHCETVLLDENLINMTCDSPLYVLPHSKTVLMQAIHNDTLFLASLSVMDYSLLVGLDETNSHLVLGIIDYIRGYTWDKKLETMVKSIGQAKAPTIIPADEYRKRFIAAMHRYFLPVPDRWTGLGQGIDVYTRDMAG